MDFDNLPIPELEKQVRKDVEVKAQSDSKIECFKRRDRSDNNEFTGTIDHIIQHQGPCKSSERSKGRGQH